MAARAGLLCGLETAGTGEPRVVGNVGTSQGIKRTCTDKPQPRITALLEPPSSGSDSQPARARLQRQAGSCLRPAPL
jgi:hypothetical protein